MHTAIFFYTTLFCQELLKKEKSRYATISELYRLKNWLTLWKGKELDGCAHMSVHLLGSYDCIVTIRDNMKAFRYLLHGSFHPSSCSFRFTFCRESGGNHYCPGPSFAGAPCRFFSRDNRRFSAGHYRILLSVRLLTKTLSFS